MRRVSHDLLTALIARMIEAAGAAAEEARLVAENLVTANLKGHDSHGVALVPRYVESALDGRIKLGQRVKVVRDDGAFLLLDGGMGFGQVIGIEAMRLGIARARALGVAVVGLRNVHHLGRIGAWGEMCAEAGFVSTHYVNGIGVMPIVAPYGGSDARFTTNPYCAAFPATDGPPIILDMATSKIAMGKVLVAHNKGTEVPSECLIDNAGNPSVDPGVMFSDGVRVPRGALLPMGLHKGYGLAIVCEILAGALTGGGVTDPDRFPENGVQNNMLSVIIDPARFGDGIDLAGGIDTFTRWIKASPVAPGHEAIMVPGDPERKSSAERTAHGVPLDDGTWHGLVEAARKVNLDADAYLATAA